ncbi:hypothetical protein [Halobacteriovorax sp.]|uniref:hypothetical protein n=1 Tax=Halobacteriovorax sp. TaxID=2020862 RepID=UPI003AF2FC8A
MKFMKFTIAAMALSLSTFAADSSANGSITLSGLFSPKVSSIKIALADCGKDVSLNDCDATLASTTFGTYSQDATLDLGTFDGEENIRYVKFEIKSQMLLFKGDYLKIAKSLTSSTNDIAVTLEKMVFVSAGSSVFGQQTLGNATSSLSAGDVMVSSAQEITSTSTEVYNSSSDAPGVANGKVLSALTNANALTVRGILAVEAGDEATSSTFNAEINVAFTGVDGL